MLRKKLIRFLTFVLALILFVTTSQLLAAGDLISSTARGSLLAGNNITIKTGKNEETSLSQTQITGSNLQASGDTRQSQNNTEHVDATRSQTIYGAAGGPT